MSKEKVHKAGKNLYVTAKKVSIDLDVFTVKFPIWEQQNVKYREKIFELREDMPEGFDLQKGNTTWHSLYTLHLDNIRTFNPLIQFTKHTCEYAARYILKTPANFTVYNMWAMTYDEGQETLIHNHFPSCFSAVYFVDVEDNAAPLMLGNDAIQPEEGTLIVFPSLTPHYVPPTEGKRVIISMNLEGDSKEKFKMSQMG